MSKEQLDSVEEEIRLFFEQYEKEHENQQLTPQQIAFDEPLRSYRDLKNVIETARQDGYQAGLKARAEAEAEKHLQEMVLNMLQAGLPDDQVMRIAQITADELAAIIERSP